MIKIKTRTKHILVETFLFEGKVKVDYKYFIEKIEESVNSNTNNNYKTNVHGKMTPWLTFNNDEKFKFFLEEIKNAAVNVLKKNMTIGLAESWGNKYDYLDSCHLHDHKSSELSGVLYLTKNNSGVYFPEYDLEILPEPGKFILFSPFLKHEVPTILDKKPRYCIAFNFNNISFLNNTFHN